MDEKTELKPSKMSGPRKTAIFLLAMGEDYASKIFKRMSNQEIKKVASIMAEIDHITPEELDAVSQEFIASFEGDMKLVIAGETFSRNVIGNALGNEFATSIFEDIEAEKRDLPFDWSRKVDIHALANYIESEHPQTIAMVLAHLPSDISSEIMSSLPDDQKGDIAMRIAHLGQVPEEIVRAVDEALKSELSTIGGSGGKSGGLQVLVDIINGLDKASEEVIMEAIEEEQAEMAADIRAMMFVFEDLVRVDDKGFREILKKVESSQLTLALKTASEEMSEKIFKNLSARAVEMLKEDLEVMGPTKLSEVEEAQQAIVSAAKELEAEGSITLGGKGKDDILV
ncbi:MAG: flagellar motor switch protein FliG [Proteobacteria bacterium]|nr:flagellar motor switch protein FliG [Pseudomonadota bacterium]